MDNQQGGFLGGLAGQVKSEQRDINTIPMAKWEDVGRIRAQTWNMAGLRAWQIAALLFTALAWAYTISAYRKAEIIPSNDMTLIINALIVIVSLVIFAVIVLDIRRDVVDSGAQWVVIAVASLIEVGMIFLFAPVATWALMNMFLIGYVPFLQIVAAGWVPVMLSIIALSIVPDFQIGHFAWWRELTNQPAASSEKQVEDVTAIEIKRMELEHEQEKWERSNNVVLELEIAREEIRRLTAQVSQLQSLPPATRFVPMNHSTARASYGDIVFSALSQNGKLSDQDALWKFVAEFEERGTSRDRWTGTEDQQQAQTHISQPQWEKITRALKNLKILDANNSPLVTSAEVRGMLQNPPTPL